MAREVGTLKLGILSAALIGGLALPAQAEEFNLGGTATFTTDYVFRGISQTDAEPGRAGLDRCDLRHVLRWHVGIERRLRWRSAGQDIADIEIDYYAGITPEWKGISFDIAGPLLHLSSSLRSGWRA